MKMTQKQTLFVKGDVVSFIFNNLNYEATMTRTHYSSYKVYMLKNVKLIDGGNQMERATIKSSLITNIKKIHDEHAGEDIIINIQHDEPIEPEQQNEEPEQQNEQPIDESIDEPIEPEQQNEQPINEPIEPEQQNEELESNISQSHIYSSNLHDKIEKFLNMNSYCREPLKKIILNMLEKYNTLTGDSIERHNFGNRPSKLNDIPDYNQMNEDTLYEILENNNEKTIIEQLGGDVQLGKKVQACIIMWISLYIYRMPVLYILKDSETERQQLGKYIDGTDELSFNYQFIKLFFEEYLDLRKEFKKYQLPYFQKFDYRNIAYYHTEDAYDLRHIDCCLMNCNQLEKFDNKFNEYVCTNKQLVNITVIVDEGKVKASKSSKNDRCKADKLLRNICKKCRYVLLLSDTTTITKQPDISDKSDDSDEQIQHSNNEGSGDILYKSRLLYKYRVESKYVCDRNKVVRDFKTKQISFDEAKLKIKQMQNNTLKEDNCINLRRIIPIFSPLKNEIKEIKSNSIEFKTEYDERNSIMRQYKDDQITYEDAYTKIEIIRDTIKSKTTQPTRQHKYFKIDHNKDLFTDV